MGISSLCNCQELGTLGAMNVWLSEPTKDVLFSMSALRSHAMSYTSAARRRARADRSCFLAKGIIFIERVEALRPPCPFRHNRGGEPGVTLTGSRSGPVTRPIAQFRIFHARFEQGVTDDRYAVDTFSHFFLPREFECQQTIVRPSPACGRNGIVVSSRTRGIKWTY